MNSRLVRNYKKFVSEVSASDFNKLPAWRDGDEKPTFLFENKQQSSIASLDNEDSDFNQNYEGVLDILSDD